MSYSIYDIVGNLGVVLIVGSYLLLQINKVKSSSLSYSMMNLLGASFVIISLIENFNLSAFIIEAFWIGISFIGIINYLRNKNS
ncbi:MAG: hypothetical protein GY936_14010 [Ignavibacteriae bacterium]|nr:hypothetical protein [Ignavibacteriota bacterium]